VGKKDFLKVGGGSRDAPLQRIKADTEHDARQYHFVQQQNLLFEDVQQQKRRAMPSRTEQPRSLQKTPQRRACNLLTLVFARGHRAADARKTRGPVVEILNKP
jgi:hypothetical protein